MANNNTQVSQAKREFVNAGTPLTCQLNGSSIVGTPKEFSTGSCGWNFNGKATVQLPDGTEVRVQFSGNAVIIGSKEW